MMPSDAFRSAGLSSKNKSLSMNMAINERLQTQGVKVGDTSQPNSRSSSNQNTNKMTKQYSMSSLNINQAFEKAKPRIIQFFNEVGVDTTQNKINQDNVFELILARLRPKILDIQGKNKQLIHRINQQEIRAENYDGAIKELELVEKGFKEEIMRLETQLTKKNREISELRQHVEVKQIEVNWLRPKLEQYNQQIKRLASKEKETEQKIVESRSRKSSMEKQFAQTKKDIQQQIRSRSVIEATLTSAQKKIKLVNQDFEYMKMKYDKSKQAYYRLVRQSEKTENQLNQYIGILQPQMYEFMRLNSVLVMEQEATQRNLTQLEKDNRRLEREMATLSGILKGEIAKSKKEIK